MTPTQLRAVQIIAAHDIRSAHQFARLMWPDAAGWRVACRAGPHGVAKGKAMWTMAGGYITRLEKAGLVKRGRRHPLSLQLTDAARAALAKLDGGK